MTTMVLEKHIVATQDTRSGKPRINNTRITVADVVIWTFRLGYSVDEIAIKWSLPMSAVHAALAYYYDYRDEIDAEIEEADKQYTINKAQNPSILQQKLIADTNFAILCA